MLYNQLIKLNDQKKSIKVGLIGVGKFGTMFASQAIRLPGVHIVGVADLVLNSCKSNLKLAGWSSDRCSATSIDEALISGKTYVTQDYLDLVEDPRIDIIVECTGNPVAAVDHLLAAFSAGKHAISATVEADALCGVSLALEAQKNRVVYSMAYGDQPAMVCELVDWARVCGFDVVAAGRGHKWKP